MYDGLNYEIVDYLNSEENRRANARLLEELRAWLDRDEKLKKLYEQSYTGKLSREEFEQNFFPYRGGWYLCANGCGQEQEDTLVTGPYSTEELIHVMLQKHYWEKKDPLLLDRDVTDRFSFQGGFALPRG